MVRSFRGVCLVCFCILAIALAVAILEFAALPVVLHASGCHLNEMLPGFACGDGFVGRLIELVLNLPFLFVYAPAFTLFTSLAPRPRDFMLLLYLFDILLIFALIYPVLVFFGRETRKP